MLWLLWSRCRKKSVERPPTDSHFLLPGSKMSDNKIPEAPVPDVCHPSNAVQREAFRTGSLLWIKFSAVLIIRRSSRALPCHRAIRRPLPPSLSASQPVRCPTASCLPGKTGTGARISWARSRVIPPWVTSASWTLKLEIFTKLTTVSPTGMTAPVTSPSLMISIRIRWKQWFTGSRVIDFLRHLRYHGMV